MLSTIQNAWKVPELRKRILFTVLMVAVYRMGIFIPVPGVDVAAIQNLSGNGGTLLGFYDLLSGGAFHNFSIFSLGVMPFINASIIMQLLTIAIPRLEQMNKEGEEGRKKIQQITRYLSIPLGAMLAFSQYAIITRLGGLTQASKLEIFLIIVTLTAGATFLMWVGDQITAHGLGNGVSLMIFINIISRTPSMIYSIFKLTKAESANIIPAVVFAAIYILMFVGVLISTLAERRIPVQYAGKTVGNKTYKGQSSHIPINVNNSGVIAIIFALSVLQFPLTIAEFFPKSTAYRLMSGSDLSPFKNTTWTYALLYFLLTLFFTWFYTQVTFKPEEMSENMHKSSGFIPGVRPGEPTTRHIEKVLDKVSLFGGTFAGLIAVIPIVFAMVYGQFQNIQFGGTSLLIEVSVALETLKVLQSQLVMRHYTGFLK